MPRRFADKSKDAYSPRSGGQGKKGQKIGPATRETSTIASKQQHGGPNHGGMPPRKGFPSLPMEG
jgi:hypothetical protein